LQGQVDRYVFVSSVSVYAGAATPNDEDSPLGVIEDPDTDVVDGRTYGPLKALCEGEVARRFGEAAMVLRPGLIVGPFDPTQRFTYWPARIARADPGDAVLAPGSPEAPLQWIDARDLAGFVLRALADEASGTFNLVGEPGQSTMGRLLQTCADVAGTQPVLRWADMGTLQALGLQPWSDLPLALPDDDEHRGFMRTDVRRALAAGLRIRPAARTVADTLAWHRSLPLAQQVFDKAGLSAAREAAVLSAIEHTGSP
jgi:2'-hydroxyisoflavone reductase